jgi:4-aminobutyrate aminotransferase/(S)-3-amino-2-methylpropionate transaminase
MSDAGATTDPDTLSGEDLPSLVSDIPGPVSKSWVERLARTESPAITARRARRAEQGGADQDPIVWAAARGANVQDVDGNVYVDLTGAFAVASVGHSHPAVSAAAAKQAGTLIHAMGDVYPATGKIELAERLAELAPGDLEVSIFASSGAEAVEVAIKTAVMATKRSTILTFGGSYHGLSLGALSVTGYRDSFRAPFRGLMGRFGVHLPYPNSYRCPLGFEPETCEAACLDMVEHVLDDPASGIDDVAAVLVEPIQGRGGVVVPPDGWLAELATICHERDVLLIVDEIYTGFGRTGRWFACEHDDVRPDLMCVGKAMGGGFPISACLGTRRVMDAWGLSSGESIHTSTFLGNPLGCAMALATLDVIEDEDLVERAVLLGETIRPWAQALQGRHPGIGDVRGRGAMWGLELVKRGSERAPDSVRALAVTRGLLRRGFLVLPSGVYGNVISLVPPLAITKKQLAAFFDALDETLREHA